MNRFGVKRKKVMLMTFGDPATDPRPNRMIKLFHSLGYTVDILCPIYSGSLPIGTHFQISKMHGARLRYPSILLNLLTKIFKSETDFISEQIPYCDFNWVSLVASADYEFLIVEDLQLLPGAMALKGGGNIIFDAREYYPLQNEENIWWQLFERPDRIRLCKRFLNKVDLFLTVSPGLSEAYNRNFGVQAQLFRSTPNVIELTPQVTNSSKIKLVHHGVANKNRQLHKMIELMGFLDSRFELDMYLTGDSGYINTLRKVSNSYDTVKICAPIPYDELIKRLNEYDIGIFYNEPTTFNLRHSLPNKIFEFIQARLAVAIAPSPDMKELIENFGCGIVASGFTVADMAYALNALSANQIDQMKGNSQKAAKVLNFDVEKEILIERLYDMIECKK